MNTVTRYVIKMKQGNYMRQDFEGSLDAVWINTVDHPIDADLLKEKSVAVRVLDEILSGNTNLIVMYDDDNPPIEVVELQISIQ